MSNELEIKTVSKEELEKMKQTGFIGEYKGIPIHRIRGFEFISKEQFIKDFKEEFKNNVLYTESVIEDIYNTLKLPTRATAKAAGYDVYSPIAFTLQPNEEIKIPTGFKVYMQNDEWIGFLPRSGQGFKYYIRLANTEGVGDSDYYNNKSNEGHYFVKIRNEGSKVFSIKKGEAIAQSIFHKYLLVDGDSFDGEERIGGFGSTNK